MLVGFGLISNVHCKDSSLLANCVLLLTGSLQLATSHSAHLCGLSYFSPPGTKVFWVFLSFSQALVTTSANAALLGEIR